MKRVWYPIKLKFDEEIKKQWKVEEVYMTKIMGKSVKSCSDFMCDNWLIVVEYCSDKLSVCLLTRESGVMSLAHFGNLRLKEAMGTLHYGDPDLFDKMVELVESFGPVFETN